MTIRYRKMDALGDYVFGQRYEDEFLIDSPEAVRQSLTTRLLLSAGEWFLDLSEGTPYTQAILGFAPTQVRDFALRSRILDTPGVKQITTYESHVDDQRNFSMTAAVETIFGPVVVDYTL